MTTIRRVAFLVAALLCTVLVAGGQLGAAARQRVTDLERAHAHNDFEHDRPLFDALENGFKSVEADVWLVGDELLVAHDLVDVDPDLTLEALYLEPLAERVRRNRGSVYRGDPHTFQLLIDIKSEPVTTYLGIHNRLKHYERILTTFTSEHADEGAVTAVISGNRPRELMQAQTRRFAAYDGRLTDLSSDAPATLIPLISDNWTSHFAWTGVGEMPEDERQKLHAIVTTAHADGRRVRFWNTPDAPGPEREAVWHELLNAGVDYINTDDLSGLNRFLLEHDPQPTIPFVDWFSGGGTPAEGERTT